MSDQEAIGFLLRENQRIRRMTQRWRVEAYRQRLRAELWRDRALKKKR